MSSNDFLTESGKEEMKKAGGRRKQCKPVKVFVAENGFSEEDKTCTEGYSKVNGNVLSENNSLTNGGKELHDKDYLAQNPMSENCQPIVCPDCGGVVPTMAALDQHIKFVHCPQDPDASTCPTPYHQLARDLQKSTASTQLEKIASKIDLEKLSSAEEDPKEIVINLRLTTKELAEKPVDKKSEPEKKIQVSSSPPNVQMESKPEHLPPPYVDPVAKLNQQQNQSFLDRVVEQELAKHSPLFEMLKNSTKPQTPNGQQQQQSFLNSNDFPAKYSMPVTVDTEDFCHLCQKHFCNKYYLRKHKQDVHGISSDANSQTSSNQTSINGEVSSLTSDLKTISSSAVSLASTPLQKVKSSESLQLPEPFSSMMSSLPFGLPFSGDLSSSFLFPPTSMTSQQSGFFNNASTISNLASLMLLNPFASPLSLMKNPPLLQQPQNSSQTPSSLNTLIELQNFGLTNGLLGDVASLKNNLLYKFPTADQPAPCDLCQKEFCNTYFLKVHKRDKHGIPLEESSNSIPVKKQANNSKIGPAPLFSLDGIEPGENILPMNKLRPDDKNPFHFGSKRAEETCFLCKQHFSSRYNLMMHLLSSHNIKPEGFGLASELMQMELLNGSQLPFSKPAGNTSNSGKTSERVACNICNKEVCNKYFLKTHKLKVHGIQEGGSESNSATEHAKNQPAVVSLSEPMDSKNLHLDQLMQKYDEIAKQFTSMPLDLNRKSLDTKAEPIKKEIDIQNKPQPIAYSAHEGSSLHKIVPDKTENATSMFGSLDMIAKNKFDYKINEFQNLTNHYNLFDFPQSFKNLGATVSGKNKLPNFSKHYFGKDGKLSDDGAAKLGYDPEAYCEICKKEFCSKYFLKTHKQKIHGVRYDGTSDSRSPSLSQTTLNSLNIPTSFVQDQNLSLFSFDGSSSGNKGKEPLPSNMTRVTCEICGKELCNKYFLRTHMLKIHGISDSIPAPKNLTNDTNKQEITNTLRKESPTGENPASDIFHQQKYRPMQDLKPPFIKSNDSNQTQNLVIGVKELKQVTEMLLQSSESCSSFQQSYDGDVNNHYDRDSVVSSTLHDSVKNDNPSKIERQCAMSSEPKTPQQTFPRDANDKSWKEEFLKLQSFMSGHQDTDPLRSELLANRKRRLDNGEVENKSNKKHINSSFGEKENEKTKAVRLTDLQNKYSPHAGIPEFASSQRREEFAKMENNRDETTPVQANNCILQPFEMQERPNENAFAQCKVFLPVVQPICEPITLKFTVTPVDH